MRFTTVLAGVIAVVACSVSAAPLFSDASAHDENTLSARDYNLVVRDVLQAIHARELADLDDAIPIGIGAFPQRRDDELRDRETHIKRGWPIALDPKKHYLVWKAKRPKAWKQSGSKPAEGGQAESKPATDGQPESKPAAGRQPGSNEAAEGPQGGSPA
ncbi:hypothetical protein EIP91_001087 [Steccherinum ochraceum]|uniref:Uncharacterized protein n=1 Tax=Steccherinum ochraceum TaxID=92696 RepID=A0A4R0RN59_9APHY|nr:hypothetical protein EIP91_001087 [Steccherinum ochraceum]